MTRLLGAIALLAVGLASIACSGSLLKDDGARVLATARPTLTPTATAIVVEVGGGGIVYLNGTPAGRLTPTPTPTALPSFPLVSPTLTWDLGGAEFDVTPDGRLYGPDGYSLQAVATDFCVWAFPELDEDEVAANSEKPSPATVSGWLAYFSRTLPGFYEAVKAGCGEELGLDRV